MTSRRLEDRIRELCGKALTANDHELSLVIPELQAALHEAIERLRIKAVSILDGGATMAQQRRRS
jgi:hypothetical protein